MVFKKKDDMLLPESSLSQRLDAVDGRLLNLEHLMTDVLEEGHARSEALDQLKMSMESQREMLQKLKKNLQYFSMSKTRLAYLILFLFLLWCLLLWVFF